MPTNPRTPGALPPPPAAMTRVPISGRSLFGTIRSFVEINDQQPELADGRNDEEGRPVSGGNPTMRGDFGRAEGRHVAAAADRLRDHHTGDASVGWLRAGCAGWLAALAALIAPAAAGLSFSRGPGSPRAAPGCDFRRADSQCGYALGKRGPGPTRGDVSGVVLGDDPTTIHP